MMDAWHSTQVRDSL